MSYDATAIQQTIQRALESAGLDTRGGPMRDVTEVIRRALNVHPLDPGGPAADRDAVIDVDARVVTPDGDASPAPGRVEVGRFANAAGERTYRVHVPAATGHAPRAVIVMLHGCNQSAEDFAAGTQMNRLADAHGFLVVYPEQSAHANPSKCWSWFQPQDQTRDAGEPSLIAGIVREVVQRHGADPRRVFVAGLSAGAAMAVVLGETYPELFAGVGAHSGLPYGSAQDVPSALAAMKGGRSGLPGLRQAHDVGARARRKAVHAVPVIVFHGDRDATVHQTNGDDIVRQAREAHARATGGDLRVHTEAGTAPGGRRFSRTIHTDAAQRAWIESWTVHGAGHAWSGGHPGGAYTDRMGPDASAQMVRFFMAQPPGGAP